MSNSHELAQICTGMHFIKDSSGPDVKSLLTQDTERYTSNFDIRGKLG